MGRHNAAGMRTLVAAVLAVMIATACSSESPGFTVSDMRVDSAHWCPGGAVDTKYDVHATIQAHNPTENDVTIKSGTAEMVLAKVTGHWLEKVGDRYNAGAIVVSPSTIAARSTAKLDVTIPSTCTSGLYGSTQSSSGSYTVTLHLTTSAGAFTIAAANRHEILGA